MTSLPLPRQKNLRADCAWAIYQILEQGRSSRDVLAKVQRRHSAQDNAWIHEMTMGVMRQLPVLQRWLRQLLHRPLKGQKKAIEHLIMLGLYQQAFTRVSAHAAVAETVNAAAFLGGAGLKGLVNAILRNFSRQGLADAPVDDPIVASGFPKWLYKAIQRAYPDALASILTQSNTPAPVWLRVNRLKTDRDRYARALDEHNIEYTCPASHPDAIVLTTRCDITTLPGFEQGWFAVQDGAAQLAALLLAPQAGERILDCCAAPGGKTGHIMERAPELSQCVALDADEGRLDRVHENMQRLGHQPEIVCADASATSWWDGVPFDRILLDAPCSATGVIRRHPDIRWLRKRTDIEALVTLQAQILDNMWQMLKPGGCLLYATCSVLPDENRDQIARFLSNTPDASLLPLTDTETPAQPGRQILPGEAQMDGFYYARLIKSTG
ncbi:16S rRNA (cytosine(967)-C(5))-methyltransferase RsmB [Alteromonas sp. ASW11-19]|uniref:16S rRNA (cytosine(967)-C(5))-methyltransferase n=1 Tax=Alteromonas salexigens TaxID=2982530 RepID=A0ABT2VK49_9ALTE|nr:16S rRNA (cytosine(967)-C(5))-methyltransferase RsmB [Alteromonas salexigens]MCU7553636.1 16S rRNA (cytosine(967)-C(5))-methyltransferase RsmB [Alteromonas salexigens]